MKPFNMGAPAALERLRIHFHKQRSFLRNIGDALRERFNDLNDQVFSEGQFKAGFKEAGSKLRVCPAFRVEGHVRHVDGEDEQFVAEVEAFAAKLRETKLVIDPHDGKVERREVLAYMKQLRALHDAAHDLYNRSWDFECDAIRRMGIPAHKVALQ